MKNELTPEQKQLYDAVLKAYENHRNLSQEEKESLLLDLMSRKYIDLLCDWAFKHVFGHNEKNLLLLLNDILPEKIVHIEYEPGEIDRFKGDDKNVIMDVICHTDDGRKIIVEMQRQDKTDIRNRLYYYAAALIYKQLTKGLPYSDLMPVYVICFMNFRLNHEVNKLIYDYQIRESSGELYGNQATILLCELPRMMKKTRKKMTPVEIWFDLLQNMTNFAEKPEEYGAKYNPIFESSLQQPIPVSERTNYLKSMFGDKIQSVLTDEDRQEAFLEGKAEERTENARRLMALGVNPEIICKALGLSAEELAAL